MPTVADHRFLVSDVISLLSDSEDVQGKPAAEGDLELVHVSEPGKQHKRDEGVRAQEQQNVAGVVVVVVGRGVITASPHDAAGESLKLNLAPHGPFRMPACAPAVACRDCAAQPQQRQRNSDEPAGRREDEQSS